jgi:bifunctional UDP-N-acetylglucosamine pyrophosphorylase/glucosamine-1-phosphate N-acetyltransferase
MVAHVCILAAGQSKRMKSKTSKLLHRLGGRTMIEHVQKTISEIGPDTIGIVVGYQRDQIIDALSDQSIDFIVQEKQLGTAHAVAQFLNNYPAIEGPLLVLSGDTPLVSPGLLRAALALYAEKGAKIVVITTMLENPAGYGRVVRHADGSLERVVEDSDASAEQKKIREVNTSLYVFDIALLRRLIPKVQTNNKQKEYYLPDVIELAMQDEARVIPLLAPAHEVVGINTQVELAAAAKILRKKINEMWMLRGVGMVDPDRTYIDSEVQFGTDVTLYPNIYLEGSTMIASEVTIYPNCRITDCYIDSGCVIYENSSLDSAHVESGVKIGPFARIRPDTYISSGARIGNFVELKKTTVGKGSKANHLSYLGDATIGSGVNIGAGTITCNYDGEKKYQTVIEDGVFIGSDTQLIAPVKVGKDAYVGAGSSITEDVPPGSLAIARGRQVIKSDWVANKKKKNKP